MRARLMLMASLAVSGCWKGNARIDVVYQAAFDHDCPVKRISILDENSSILAYRLDVCGKMRKYRDMGNEREFQFVDVTDGPVPAPRHQ